MIVISMMVFRQAASGLRMVVVLILFGLAVFAHGCHRGDIDHELCAPDRVQAIAK